MRKDIWLPHLAYMVRVRAFKPDPAIPLAEAYVRRDDQNSCTIYLKPKAQDHLIVHELMHVIQRICEDRYMDFTLDREHTAYLMQYLFNRIRGFSYAKPKKK